MAAYDDNHLPEWQRWLNQFCENWIFAFLVAMAIRHFCLEAFRIPTASMEPMLYGDPGLLKGDQVVVDKLTPRFTGYSRWDVTVFQFPRPELENGDDARPALSVDGERLDSPLLHPLFGRNFVKRLLALPGDEFYIAGGDLHLKQPDGTWAVARKPPRIQEALWQDIYLQGDQAGYLPWQASGTSAVSASGDGLDLTLGDQPVRFTQPLSNLYLKPGNLGVAPLAGKETVEVVEAAMTRPLFTWHGRQGNLWDLSTWRLLRMTSKDLDANQGRVINDVATEMVGDVRLVATVASLSGTAALTLDQGNVHAYRLELSAEGWRVVGDGAVLGSGSGSPVGKELRFAHLDGQLLLSLDGAEVLRKDVPDVDPTVQRTHLALVGSGKLALSAVRLQRDVHYCVNGFLANDGENWKSYENKKNNAQALDAERAAEGQRVIELVRSQMRGKAELTSRERVERWGYSPETRVVVPPGCYLLLGDNSTFSWDGRYWGFVPEVNLRGRALAVMFPPQRWRVIR